MKIITLNIIATLLAGTVHSQAQRYFLTDLGTLRANGLGTSSAAAINTSGVIVGVSDSDAGGQRAFRLKPGGPMEDLGFINNPAYPSFAYAINAAGVVSGMAVTQSGSFAEAFRYEDGTGLTPLPWLPGGGDCYGRAINADGKIVGWSNRGIGCGGATCPGNPGYAVRWIGSTIEAIGGLGGYYSDATGINDAGEVCGYGAVTNNPAITHAFRIPAAGGAAIDLGTLGGFYSEADAINNSGHIVGTAQLSGNASSHAALWISSTAEDLGSLPGKSQSQALAISDGGEIVGFCSDTNGVNPRATLFRPGVAPTDLNTLIEAGSGWLLTYARGINSSGRIVGVGLTNGVSRAFLLTPYPALSIQLLPAQVELCWNSETNRPYQLQYCSDLTTHLWSNLGTPIQGNGATNYVYDSWSPGQAQKFFRIWLTNAP
jgi:probable HAF family extracellular repeat protein